MKIPEIRRPGRLRTGNAEHKGHYRKTDANPLIDVCFSIL